MPAADIPQTLDAARNAIALGKLAEAEAACRAVLRADAQNAECHFLLGVVAFQAGRIPLALELASRAAQLAPLDGRYRMMVGVFLCNAGRHFEGLEHLRAALPALPRSSPLRNHLGTALLHTGDVASAIAEYRSAIALDPANVDAHSNLGNALKHAGQTDEAIAAYRAGLAVNPQHAAARYNLGNTFRVLRRNTEALEEYDAAIRSCPGYAQAHSNRAAVLLDLGQVEASLAAAQEAIRHQPGLAEGHTNLGSALAAQGERAAALAAHREAMRLNPASALAHYNVGTSLRDLRQLDDAAEEFRAALRLQPDHFAAATNLGDALRAIGDVAAAVASFRRASALRPSDAALASNVIYALQFLEDCPESVQREERARWDQRHAGPCQAALVPAAERGPADRRLKIGYVSPDFGRHSVAFFMLPVFAGHDRLRVEVFGYANGRGGDELTERFRAAADGWRDVAKISDEALAAQIRADDIDILVDLTMHSAGNRLLAFARKPAPVQASWLAYPGTTGLGTIDYRITDRFMEPVDSDERERPLRLPDSWCCFEPVTPFPEVSPLPAVTAGFVTFGSLNHPAKVNDSVLRCWARILISMPKARLLMMAPEGRGRTRVLDTLARHGVTANRVDFADHMSWDEYAELYGRIDLCLDPFPVNGMTMTCHALWMGVPVVTWPREQPASRAGLSLMTTVGLPEFVASSEDDYVAISTQIAGDLDGLAHIRATLRERMKASPLMDRPRFIAGLEDAYRRAWRDGARADSRA